MTDSEKGARYGDSGNGAAAARKPGLQSPFD